MTKAVRDDALRLRRTAQAHEEAGDFEAAEPLWRRVLDLRPDDMDAPERLALGRIIHGELAASPANAPRVLVLGNCQSYSISACLRALNPDLMVAALSWTELRTTVQVERLLAIAEGADAVLVQPVEVPRVQSLSADALAGRGVRCVQFPRIHFTGFHPDAVRMRGRALEGLIGPWHSALIMAGYRMGLPEDRTEALFNAYVYGALGYFDEYDKACTFQDAAFSALGWDPLPRPKAGTRPFVHVPYHPRIEAMMELARSAGARLGIEIDRHASPPPDPLLRFGAWPVYPEIGKRLGLPGDVRFVPPGQSGGGMDLREAISRSYAAYARSPERLIPPPRVKHLIEILKAEGI